MPFSDYSTNPTLNVTINGINIAEGCSPSSVNNALRQLAADGKTLNNIVSAIPAAMPVSGGAFTGDISRQGRGPYLHHASGAFASARVFVQPVGGSTPSGMLDGDILIEY